VTKQPAAVKCPACGSTDIVAIPLAFIESRYYRCGACVATFRELAREHEPVDTFPLGRDTSDPGGKKTR